MRSDDIIIINPDPLTTKKAVGPIRSRLFEQGINSHTAGVDTTPDVFFSQNDDSIAFSGIYRAKGNEAAMVYIVNTESCYNSMHNLAKIRNQLFTAITRSKAWVRILGVGENMRKLIQEYSKVKQHDFTLDFIYPTKSERERLNIVNRDISNEEQKEIIKSKKNMDNLIKALENNKIFIDDLDENQIENLINLLGKGK